MKRKNKSEITMLYCKPLQWNKDTCTFHAIAIETTSICVIGLGSVIICFKNEIHFLQ